MTVSSKRAEHVAIASLILSVIFFAVTFFIGRWSGFFAVSAISWLILSAVLICSVLIIQFHQRSLAEQEKLDVSQSLKTSDTSTIFQAKSEGDQLLLVVQNRLKLLEKWFLPIFASLIALYQIVIGLYLFKNITTANDLDTQQPLLCAVCMTAVAFVCFIVCRYATGMSVEPLWNPLRAIGSTVLTVAVVCFALAIGLALAQFKIFILVNIVSWLVSSLLIAIGVETVLNVVLDIYRPRIKKQYRRSAFDSRLLGIINEPGSILKSAAGAVDYQFGFKVSQTWFYKLLEKAVVPLILFAIVILYLLSGVVIINPNEEAVIEHFGNPINQNGQVRLVGAGMTLKWPWPIDIAYKYPVKEIQELNIGFVPKIDPKTGSMIREPLLWGQSHYEQEHSVLVASKQIGLEDDDTVPPVSLLKANMPIQFKVEDLYAFLYNHSDAVSVLESICYQELAKFAASAKIEVDEQEKDSNDFRESLLGAGRMQAKCILSNRIQTSADETGLGVKVVFVGLQGIHPPPEVAEDYEKVVSSIQQKQAIILMANAQRNRLLSMLAGSVKKADELYDLINEYQQAEESEETNVLRENIDKAFIGAKGDIFTTLSDSHTYAYEKKTLAKATGQRFASQLKAYMSSPNLYKQEKRLEIFEESLNNIRKYVVIADKEDTQVFIVDVQEKLTPSLYELGGFGNEENAEK